MLAKLRAEMDRQKKEAEARQKDDPFRVTLSSLAAEADNRQQQSQQRQARFGEGKTGFRQFSC